MAADVAGRGLAKGKTGAQHRVRTPGRRALQGALDRRRPAARRARAQPWTTLWSHVYDIHRRREAYHGRHREATAGVDGQTWAADGESLEAHLRDLSDRLKRGAYHWVLDADSREFVAAIDPAGLLKVIEHRIGAQRVGCHR